MIYTITFSPTRTGAKVARAIAEGLADALPGQAVVEIDVTTCEASPKAFGPGDTVVVAAPVYGGHIPQVALTRLEPFAGNGARCVLAAVYGNRGFEHALADMYGWATGHGFATIAAGAWIGEHSYSRPETPIAQGRPDVEDLRIARETGSMAALATAQLQGVEALVEPSTPKESLAAFREFVVQYQAAQKSAPVKLLPTHDGTRCTWCGRCTAVCPTGAIDSSTHATDPGLCIKCSACVKACSQGARTLTSPFAPVLSRHFGQRKPPVWIMG